MSGRWYVVHTQVLGEDRADLNLRRQGFETYLPRYLRTRRHARRVETVARPLFPRYLFVAMDVARDRWRAVQSTFGVATWWSSATIRYRCRTAWWTRFGRENANRASSSWLPAGIGPQPCALSMEPSRIPGVLERLAGDFRVAVLSASGREVRVPFRRRLGTA